MADTFFLDLIKQGLIPWNKWRKKYPEIPPDLSGADLSGKILVQVRSNGEKVVGVNFRSANLSKANLSKADLLMADLTDADLSEAHLENANLAGADLTEANLAGADLLRAFLEGAYLYKANLSNANLSDAYIDFAYLSYANLYNTTLVDAHLSGTDLTCAVLRNANLHSANLSGANLSKADLRGAWLTSANLSDADLSYANLTGSRVYAISAWKVNTEGAIQSDLIITPTHEPRISVDNLEIAQFIYLLLEHQKLRDVFNSVTERGVLLLGRFSDGGLELLQTIAAKLRDMRYLPIIFDFNRPDNRNLTETVMTLVGLSRFVIADLSGRSVASELSSTVPHFKIPFATIIEENRKKEIYSLFSDFMENDWVLPPVVFTSKDHLMELLPLKIIKPAEKKCEERQRRMKKVF